MRLRKRLSVQCRKKIQALLYSVIGPEVSHCLLHQSGTKRKPVASHGYTSFLTLISFSITGLVIWNSVEKRTRPKDIFSFYSLNRLVLSLFNLDFREFVSWKNQGCQFFARVDILQFQLKYLWGRFSWKTHSISLMIFSSANNVVVFNAHLGMSCRVV